MARKIRDPSEFPSVIEETRARVKIGGMANSDLDHSLLAIREFGMPFLMRRLREIQGHEEQRRKKVRPLDPQSLLEKELILEAVRRHAKKEELGRPFRYGPKAAFFEKRTRQKMVTERDVRYALDYVPKAANVVKPPHSTIPATHIPIYYEIIHHLEQNRDDFSRLRKSGRKGQVRYDTVTHFYGILGRKRLSWGGFKAKYGIKRTASSETLWLALKWLGIPSAIVKLRPDLETRVRRFGGPPCRHGFEVL
ncbi:MAG: hypothetical protein ABH863_04100 [Candidatus Micrarchaeota archaeon]